MKPTKKKKEKETMCIYKLPTTIIGHERQPTVFPSFNRVHYDTFDHIKKLFLSAIYKTQSARLPPLPAAAVLLVLSLCFCCCRRRRRHHYYQGSQSDWIILCRTKVTSSATAFIQLNFQLCFMRLCCAICDLDTCGF